MYITYHKEVSIEKELADFPHDCLDKEIRVFLLEMDVAQATYKVSSNGYYLFIYLNNGDRVDCRLN